MFDLLPTVAPLLFLTLKLAPRAACADSFSQVRLHCFKSCQRKRAFLRPRRFFLLLRPKTNAKKVSDLSRSPRAPAGVLSKSNVSPPRTAVSHSHTPVSHLALRGQDLTNLRISWTFPTCAVDSAHYFPGKGT